MLSFLILPQIKNVNKNYLLRKKIFERYIKLLQNENITLPLIENKCKSSYHIFVVGVESKKRDRVIGFLKKKNIGCSIHYKPLHKMSFYKKKYNLKKKNFSVSDNWGKSCITLPFHLKLTKREQIYVIKTLRAAILKFK